MPINSYYSVHIGVEKQATNKEDIANTLGETFLRNSSSQNYSEKFQHIKKHQEIISLEKGKGSNGMLYMFQYEVQPPYARIHTVHCQRTRQTKEMHIVRFYC